MDALETIFTRKSIREYQDKKLTEEEIHTILKAGMSGPSCVDAKDWAFIAVDDPKVLNAMADANGRPAEPLRKAAFAVLVCGDLDKAFSRAKDYWIIDGSVACQNMILAAHALGIGSVWLGTYPQMNRVEKQKELFSLPDNLIPHSVIAFGFPEKEETKEDYFDASAVHYNKW